MTLNTFGVFSTLLKQSSSGNDAGVFLPESIAKNLVIKEASSLKMLSFNMRWLLVIHYSWIETVLKDCPSAFQAAIINVLPSIVSDKLAARLNLEISSSTSYSNFATMFLLNELKNMMYPANITDEIFLPVSPINILLYLKVKSRTDLINLLGLYDLAQELRFIVDQSKLKEINDILTEKERLFLNYCISHPLKYGEIRQFIASWNGSEHTLKHHIHKQGLIFLGRALAQEDGSFLWHLLRRLDIGRAYVFEKALKKFQKSKNSDYFKDCVIKCIKVVVQ